MMDCDLICILGPTASGKTRFAVRLARRLGAEIISGDSRQVYRGMDIGTGKDLEEYGDVPYHLIDIVDAGTKYNIFQYQRDFEAVWQDITGRGARAILCGGSGLYMETVTRAFRLADVPPDPLLRAELEKCDDQTLIERLASLKRLHNTTDFDTRKRLIRELEIAIYQSEHPVERSGYLPKRTRYIGLKVDRDQRNARIDRRLRERLENGMVDEVKRLLESGISAEDLIYYGLEYKYVTSYVIGDMDYDTMVERLSIAIHQFAKRQMTWFRGMERRGIEIEWVEPDCDIETLAI